MQLSGKGLQWHIYGLGLHKQKQKPMVYTNRQKQEQRQTDPQKETHKRFRNMRHYVNVAAIPSLENCLLSNL